LCRVFGGGFTTDQEEVILALVAVAAPSRSAPPIRAIVCAPATVERLLGCRPPV
jgi:hypothetical protein